MFASSSRTSPHIPSPDLKTRVVVWLLRLVKSLRSTHRLHSVRKYAAQTDKRKLVPPEGISHIHKYVAGLPCDILTKDNATLTVLHFYGGGYCIRMPKTELPAIAKLCDRIDAQAYLPWYRLAPENKFPTGLDDCFAFYQHLLEIGIEPSRIVLSGSSAGGGNVLSLLMMLKKAALPMPACGVMHSPAGDALMLADSWIENERKDPFFKLSDVLMFGKHFVGGVERADPLLNVSLMEDFSGYPPLYISVSDKEVLRDVGVLAHEKAVLAGVESTLDVFPGGFHSMPILFSSNQTRYIWNRVEQFISQHTG